MLPPIQTGETQTRSDSIELVDSIKLVDSIELEDPVGPLGTSELFTTDTEISTITRRTTVSRRLTQRIKQPRLTVGAMSVVACLVGVRLPGLSITGHFVASIVNIIQAFLLFLGIYAAIFQPNSSKLQSYVETLIFVALFGTGVVYTQWFARSRFIRDSQGKLASRLSEWLSRGAPGWSSWLAFTTILPTAGFVMKDVPVVVAEDGWLAGATLLFYVPLQISPASLGVLSCYILASPHIDALQQTILFAGETGDHISYAEHKNPMAPSSLPSPRASRSQSAESGRGSLVDSLGVVKERLKHLDANIKRDARIPTFCFIIPCFTFYLMHLLFHLWILWDVYTSEYDDDDGIVGAQRGTSKASLLAYFGGSAVCDVGSLLVVVSPALYTNLVADRLVLVILDTYCCAPSDDGGANAAAFAMWLQKAELGWSVASFRPSLRVLKVSITSTAIILVTLITRIINN